MRYNLILITILSLLLSGCGDVMDSLQDGKEYGKTHTIAVCEEKSMQFLNECEDKNQRKCAVYPLGFARGCARTASVDIVLSIKNRTIQDPQ